MDEVDVLVVGGGPCGCAAALTLLRYDPCRVALIEGGRSDRPHGGETASAALRPLLGYLGVADAIDAAGCVMPGYSSRAAWGGDDVAVRDTLFSGRGANLHLDRAGFDATLVERVGAVGGCVVGGAWLRHVERRAGKWRVTVECEGQEGRVGGERRTFEASQVIDASGRRAAFARRAGAEVLPLDSLVAVAQRWQQAEGKAMARATLVESCEAGWWYGAPLPGGRGVVAFMTDANLLKTLGLNAADAFDACLAESRSMRRFVEGRTAVQRPAVTSACSQVLDRPVGDGWVAAGDAALAFDPLSSMGLGRAIASGIEAARVASWRLRGKEELAKSYVDDTREHLEAFLAQRASIYGAERRWRDSSFWQRRAASPRVPRRIDEPGVIESRQ